MQSNQLKQARVDAGLAVFKVLDATVGRDAQQVLDASRNPGLALRSDRSREPEDHTLLRSFRNALTFPTPSEITGTLRYTAALADVVPALGQLKMPPHSLPNNAFWFSSMHEDENRIDAAPDAVAMMTGLTVHHPFVANLKDRLLQLVSREPVVEWVKAMTKDEGLAAVFDTFIPSLEAAQASPLQREAERQKLAMERVADSRWQAAHLLWRHIARLDNAGVGGPSEVYRMIFATAVADSSLHNGLIDVVASDVNTFRQLQRTATWLELAGPNRDMFLAKLRAKTQNGGRYVPSNYAFANSGRTTAAFLAEISTDNPEILATLRWHVAEAVREGKQVANDMRYRSAGDQPTLSIEDVLKLASRTGLRQVLQPTLEQSASR